MEAVVSIQGTLTRLVVSLAFNALVFVSWPMLLSRSVRTLIVTGSISNPDHIQLTCVRAVAIRDCAVRRDGDVVQTADGYIEWMYGFQEGSAAETNLQSIDLHVHGLRLINEDGLSVRRPSAHDVAIPCTGYRPT